MAFSFGDANHVLQSRNEILHDCQRFLNGTIRMEALTIEAQALTEGLVVICLTFGFGYINLVVRIRIIDAQYARIDSDNWSYAQCQYTTCLKQQKLARSLAC